MSRPPVFCHQCGASLATKDRFCSGCGIAANSFAPGPSSQTTDHPKAPPFHKTSSSPPPLPKRKTDHHKAPVKNTSGQGKGSLLPPEIKKWNWGAFFLTWIWGIGNKTYIALLAMLPLVGIIMMFILGAKGNQWAWQNKHWDSIEHFKSVQRKWGRVALGLILLSFIVIVFSAIVNSKTLG